MARAGRGVGQGFWWRRKQSSGGRRVPPGSSAQGLTGGEPCRLSRHDPPALETALSGLACRSPAPRGEHCGSPARPDRMGEVRPGRYKSTRPGAPAQANLGRRHRLHQFGVAKRGETVCRPDLPCRAARAPLRTEEYIRTAVRDRPVRSFTWGENVQDQICPMNRTAQAKLTAPPLSAFTAGSGLGESASRQGCPEAAGLRRSRRSRLMRPRARVRSRPDGGDRLAGAEETRPAASG